MYAGGITDERKKEREREREREREKNVYVCVHVCVASITPIRSTGLEMGLFITSTKTTRVPIIIISVAGILRT